MKFEKSHFVFTPKQQNGIFLLVILMLLALGGMFYVYNLPSFANEISELKRKELLKAERFLDSIKIERLKPKKDTIYPFNPNYIDDFKGYKLGMTLPEIERLKSFRAEGKWANSAKEFQMVTQVSDSVLMRLSPFFKFPEWVKNRKASARNNFNTPISSAKKRDLNIASKEELMEVYGIGEKMSQRIINYRLKIGGFVDIIQLKDIYGLPYETEQNISKAFELKELKPFTKLSINQATVIELSEIIYFDYELAREIVEYRKLHEEIKSFEELAKIESFPAYKIDRIKLYVKLN